VSAITKREAYDVPIGFNLFSFDLFEAFRRGHGHDHFVDHDQEASASYADDADVDQEDNRRRVSDHAFCGFGYFPVL
jgi:hypothetical protein